MRTPLMLLITGLTTACAQEPCPAGSTRAEDGLCYLDEDPDGGDGGDEGDVGGGEEGGSEEGGDDGSDGADGGSWEDIFAEGDPITTVSSQLPGSDSDPMVEWMDVAIMDEERALITGQGGWNVVDLATGETVFWKNAPRGYRVAVDGTLGAIAKRTDGLQILDLTDPTHPVETAKSRPYEGYHEDIAVSEGRVMVGYLDEGVRFFDDSLAELGHIPSDEAIAVGLHGDRGVYTEGKDLVLVDLSDLGDPVELDRVPTFQEGRDLDFDGERVALGMGGGGAALYTVEADLLVLQGELEPPGSTFSVALDGNYLWMATWETVALAWVGEGGPVMLGEETPAVMAMGLAAYDGKAILADWFNQTALVRNLSVAGPELSVPAVVTVPADGETAMAVRFENHGLFDLELSVGPPSSGSGWSWESAETVLGPGKGLTVVVTAEASANARSTMDFASNDADEPEGAVELRVANQSVGRDHDPFELQGFVAPEGTLETWTFSADTNDKVIFLAYFALY